MNPPPLIVCPLCRSGFKVKTKFVFTSIVTCSCREYPQLFGIYYLTDDFQRNQALIYLHHHLELSAVLTLLGASKKTLLSLILITLPLGFLSTLLAPIRLFNLCIWLNRHLFGYNPAWANYLLKRTLIPSYFIGLAFLNSLHSTDTVADIGCGTGHLLPDINRRVNPAHVAGLDQSFMHLVLAKLFFAHPQNLLVCTDLNQPLPLASSAFDLIYANDTFHNLTDKKTFISESLRTTTPSGRLDLVHNHKKSEDTIHGLQPDRLINQLKSAGFTHTFCASNEHVWKTLLSHEAMALSKTPPHIPIPFDIYHLRASRTRQNPQLFLSPSQHRQLTRTSVFYHGDANLPAKIKLMTLMDRFSSFMFISPHLDDAVLSSGQLISTLTSLGAQVTILSVFTRGSAPPLSSQAIKHLRASGYTDTFKFFTARAAEDRAAARLLGATVRHLGFIDAAWRKTGPNFIYPNSQSQFSGLVSPKDHQLSSSLIQQMTRSISRRQVLLFGPLGVGLHADHLIIRHVLGRLSRPVIFWTDMPYSQEHPDQPTQISIRLKLHPVPAITFFPDQTKIAAIRKYSSQTSSLFPQGIISQIPEHFYASPGLKINSFKNFSRR